MCEEMSRLLRNICSIICIFEKYAKDDGDCGTLSKGELKQLIQTEFADVIVDPHDPKTIETVLHLLDTDCDGKVGFEEFTVLVFKVVKACYKKVQECQGTAGGPSKQDNSSTQQRDTPCQQVSKNGPSKRDITSIQQRDIPPQQVSKDGPSKRDITSIQQRDIPSQQVSRDGPSKRDITSTQQQDIPPHQISKDEPSQRHSSTTQQEETQTSQVSPRPCQKLVPPKKMLDAEELPQEQERRRTRLETSYDEKEQSQQEEASTCPRTQTSRVQSVQRTIEDMIRGNLTCQTSLAEMRTEQAPSQGHPSALPPRRRCLQEPLSPDQEASQDVLQTAPQQSSQQCQVEEQSSTLQEEVTSQTSGQDRRSQQSAVEMEQISAGERLQETCQRSSGGKKQQVQVEERRSASGHLRNPQVVQICDQESCSVTLSQHQNDQQTCQSQGLEQRSVVQEDQEVQAPGQVISRCQEPQMPVYRPHQEKERYPTTLECQRGPSEQRAVSQEVTRPQVAERYPRGEPGELTLLQFSQDSSPRRPFQPSQFQLKQRPLQFPPPWSTKQ
uniref:EF-hand domain-containing protein n=1 Tax=Laticauda laticaudata TaxID=8630 RepID=A0A8C5T2N7_LATLA